jgi:hypothetical protein
MDLLSGKIDIMGRAMDTYRKAQENLTAIGEARRKREREDELFKLKKTAAENKLKQDALVGDILPHQMDAYKAQLDAQAKRYNDIAKGKTAQIDQAEAGEVKKSMDAKELGTRLMQDQEVQEHIAGVLEPVYNNGRIVGVRPRKETSTKTAKTIKAEKATGDFTQKDILAEARARAKDDPEDIPYLDKIRKHMKTAKEDLMPNSVGAETSLKESEGNGKVDSSNSSKTTGKVKVKAPDGRIGYIPEANVGKAKQRGYTIVR